MNLKRNINYFLKNLPKFEDGRIDYTNSKSALVVNVVVAFKDEILILKRSSKVSTNKNSWDCVGGYYDENILPKNIAMKELKEELGVFENDIEELIELEFFEIISDKKWTIFPFIAKLNKKPKIKLDWEHTEYKWINKYETTGRVLKIIELESKLNSSKKTH